MLIFIENIRRPDHHTFNYSVDFTGGIQLLLSFNKPVQGEKLVHILDEKGWPGSVTREFSPTEHLVRVKKEAKDVAKKLKVFVKHYSKGLGDDYAITIEQTDSVGIATGSSLRTKSFWAVILSLILMLLYIALRFWSFAYAWGLLFHYFMMLLLYWPSFLLLTKKYQ